jgi:hypothetical protein
LITQIVLVEDHFWVTCWSNASYPHYPKKRLVVLLSIFR